MQCKLAAAFAAAAILIVVFAGPVLATGSRAHSASTHTVRLVDSLFKPESIKATGSATLKFVYAGKLTHNIIGPKVPKSYEQPRKRALPLTRTYGKGKYTFKCTIHPGMNLYLRVR